MDYKTVVNITGKISVYDWKMVDNAFIGFAYMGRAEVRRIAFFLLSPFSNYGIGENYETSEYSDRISNSPHGH